MSDIFSIGDANSVDCIIEGIISSLIFLFMFSVSSDSIICMITV